MPDSEASIEHLENLIPIVSQSAVRLAYMNALANGQSVLELRDGVIVEVFPDGQEREIKRVEKKISTKRGRIVSLR